MIRLNLTATPEWLDLACLMKITAFVRNKSHRSAF